jgi:quercetin dioxygenase-like cupin family protein
MTNVQINPPGTGDAVDVLGVLVRWRLHSADTRGQFAIAEAVTPAGAFIPVHSHPELEAFVLLEGSAEFARLEDGHVVWHPAQVGSLVFIPSGQMHGFRNTSSIDARLLIVCEGGLEAFFQEAGRPGNRAQQPSPADIERVVSVATRFGHRFLAA